MKIMLRTIAVAALACTMLAAPARAEPTVGETLPLLEKKDKAIVAVVMGYQNGMDWAITDVNYRTEKSLYCVPPKLSLTSDMVVKTLIDWVGTDKKKLDMPLGMALLLANEDKYPCPSNQNL